MYKFLLRVFNRSIFTISKEWFHVSKKYEADIIEGMNIISRFVEKWCYRIETNYSTEMYTPTYGKLQSNISRICTEVRIYDIADNYRGKLQFIYGGWFRNLKAIRYYPKGWETKHITSDVSRWKHEFKETFQEILEVL